MSMHPPIPTLNVVDDTNQQQQSSNITVNKLECEVTEKATMEFNSSFVSFGPGMNILIPNGNNGMDSISQASKITLNHAVNANGNKNLKELKMVAEGNSFFFGNQNANFNNEAYQAFLAANKSNGGC